MSQLIDNWGLPVIITLCIILFIAYIFVCWIATGYILDYFNLPTDGRWAFQVVLVVMFLAVIGHICNRRKG